MVSKLYHPPPPNIFIFYTLHVPVKAQTLHVNGSMVRLKIHLQNCFLSSVINLAQRTLLFFNYNIRKWSMQWTEFLTVMNKPLSLPQISKHSSILSPLFIFFKDISCLFGLCRNKKNINSFLLKNKRAKWRFPCIAHLITRQVSSQLAFLFKRRSSM